MEQKNLVLAILLSVAILFGYQFFVEKPQSEREAELRRQHAAEEQVSPEAKRQDMGKPAGEAAPDRPQLGADTSSVLPQGPGGPMSREAALKETPRVVIDSPRVRGSISLVGARIDDVVLRDYRVTTDPNSKNIVLLWPVGTEKPYYAEYGWIGQGVNLPTRSTVWEASSRTLTPETPVTLSWNNGEGLTFEQQIAIDNNYMITVTQRVRNDSGKDVTLAPYGLVSRTGTPEILDFYILHEGMIGVLNETLKEIDYGDLREDGPIRQTTTGGWLGITDKYWLAALVPDQSKELQTSFNAGERGDQAVYQADYLGEAQPVPAGGVATATNRLFAGAKEVKLLDSYEEKLGITRFDLAVDFGWFYFLTKPLFYAIDWLYMVLGNFGLAILALTVAIKLIFFPLANKSYKAMSKMKALQPKMIEMRERYGDDKQRMNQELMGLYKKEGVNPAAGCLPVIVQIPVFFALYKVLFVTIEMRHAPFYGWIDDLSAKDPLGLLNVFGLIDWNVPAMLDVVNIGLWPIIMGITMFLQQRLNPTPADPIQAKIFMFMPLLFTFILAPFPAGLVIYWAWNNILSMAQQWVIMRRMGVKAG